MFIAYYKDIKVEKKTIDDINYDLKHTSICRKQYVWIQEQLTGNYKWASLKYLYRYTFINLFQSAL